MRVLWLTNIPSPYRIKFFNELGKKCDLTVLFERTASSERDESWKQFSAQNFHAVFLKGISIGVAEAFCPSVIMYVKRGYDHIVVTNYSDLTGMLAIFWMRILGIPYEIEGDGAFPGSGKGLKELVKKSLLAHATRCFSTSRIHDTYYKAYGVKEQRIIRYPFTSVAESEVIPKPLMQSEKTIYRNKLGITEQTVFVAAGQFIHRKGFDVLIKAFADVDDSFGLYIIGGSALPEYIEMADNRKNIHFVEFLKPENLNDYYYAADIFVHPTREDIWGLVINEAIAKGLCVISTDKCIAASELIDDMKNGIIVKADNVIDLRRAIAAYDLLNPNKSIDIAKEYTIEKMSNAHIKAWEC